MREYIRPASIAALATAVILAIVAVLFRGGPVFVERSRVMMGTLVQMKAVASNEREAAKVRDAMSEAFSEIARVESVFSNFKVTSEIAKINRLAYSGLPIETTDEVLDLIETAIAYNKKTERAFDITVKPCIDLWHKARVYQKLPSEREIENAVARTGCDNIAIDRQKKTVRFAKTGMGIDLGGIAKGYAVDRAIRVLRGRGIDSAVVVAGGDMYCLGRKPGAKAWTIGVRNPVAKDQAKLELNIADRAVMTSGDYERFFTLKGKRYSHIIDPKTGSPIKRQGIGATIIAGDATLADILATSLCVLGPDRIGLVEALGADAIVIYRDGSGLKTKMTPGAKDYIK